MAGGTLTILQEFTDFSGLGGAIATTTTGSQLVFTSPGGYTLTLNGSFSYSPAPSGTVNNFVFANSGGTIASGDYGLVLDDLVGAIDSSDSAAAMTTLLAGMSVLDYSSSSILSFISLQNNTSILGNDLGDTISVAHTGVTVDAGTGADTIHSAGTSTINAGDGADTIYASSGTDSIVAGADNDTVVFNAYNQISASDYFDGGDGTDALAFTIDEGAGTGDFVLSSCGAIFHNIEELSITGGTHYAKLTLSGNQFGSGLISNSLAINIDPATISDAVRLYVTGLTAFTAAGWTTNSTLLDIQLIGASATNNKTITGSNYGDVIDANGGTGNTLLGGAGKDNITAGAGGDSINGGTGADGIVMASSAALAGASIDGGSDLARDVLAFSAAGTYDFASVASIARIDLISLFGASAGYVVTLTNALVTTADGNSDGTNGDLVVTAMSSSVGVTIDATALTGSNWISFAGSMGNDTVTGGSGDDSLNGRGGDDSIDGGAGTSDFAVFAANWLDTFITYDATTATYTIVSAEGTDTVKNVEFFTFGLFGNLSTGAAGTVDVAPDAVNDDNSGAVTGLIEAGGSVTGFDTASGNLLGNDSDANKSAGLGDDFSVTGIRVGTSGGFTPVASSEVEIEGLYGTLTIHADGSWTYVLDDNDADTQALSVGNDGSEVFSYSITDAHGLTGTATLTLAITGSNDAPVITSNGGANLSVSVNENTTSVTTVTAMDIDSSTKTWSLLGDDAARFNISSTGVVTFKAAPNREAPSDLNHDNVYKIIVKVSDGPLSDTQALSITVNNVNEAPVITSNGGASLSLAVNENATAVTTIIASDVDGPSKLWSLSGSDAALFKISSTGVVTFKTAPDFEAPKDVGKNNVYNVTVKVSDGSLFDTQNLAITVKNLNGNSIVGTTGNDTVDLTHKISGKGATLEADRIDGKAGNDTIRGSGGDDTIIGGLGKDTLFGDTGKDKFVFSATPSATNIDSIGDFTHDTDLIQLDDAIFKTIGATGALASAKFYAAAGATAAHDSNDRIIYNTTTGRLYLDDDGNKAGGHAPIWFATLSGHPTIDAGDFGII